MCSAQANLAYSTMEEQDQLLQKVLAANDSEGIAEGDRDDMKSGLSMKVCACVLYYNVLVILLKAPVKLMLYFQCCLI